MNNRYLIGDVAKYLSLSRDTLRYYDKLGIVSPKKMKVMDIDITTWMT